MMILFGIFCILVAWLFFKRYRQMSILKRNGIPGPTPNIIWGNLFTHHARPNVLQFDYYFEKYGKIMGYYIGKKPIILVNDLELVKQIQIKDFAKFSDRQQIDLKYGLFPNPKFFDHLITAKGGRWKEMRTILNPTFSAMKLKTMTPTLESSIDILISKIDKNFQKDTEFDIFEYFQLLTTDVITKSALGIDTDVQNNPRDKFLEAAKLLFDSKPAKFLLLFTCFPELDIILYPLRRAIQIVREWQGLSPSFTISKLIHAAIGLRIKNLQQKKNDLLQLMLDAKSSAEEIRSTNDANLTIDMTDDVESDSTNMESVKPLNNQRNGKNEKNVKALSHDEIVSTAIVFYEAGFETTSTTLGFIAHVLVNHPDIQEKIRQEVCELYAESGKFDYNTMNKLPYMQCVINETMRYYPPVTTFVTRTANDDYPYKNIVIPKNATVRIPIHQLHHNEEYFHRHEVFDPERFQRKDSFDPIAYQPFGNGPRNCIGMRFALYEIKLTLAKLLFKYRLVPGASTEKDLSIEYKVITETPKYGVFVKVVPV